MSFKFYLRLTLNSVLSILMAIFLSFDLLAQADTISQNTIVKQKGMYRNFDEFIKNSPSVFYRAMIERREEIINIITPPLNVYKLTFGDEKPCEKNERIWGFCDGQHFYKARNYKFNEKNVYDKIIFVGKYVYYQSTESSYSSTMMMSSAGGGVMMGGGSSKRVLELSIDPDTGYRHQSFSNRNLLLTSWLSARVEGYKNYKRINALSNHSFNTLSFYNPSYCL